MDRLGFWGLNTILRTVSPVLFQYPLMDRLGFWGRRLRALGSRQIAISVSADGSTWFLGVPDGDCRAIDKKFQYPLMDRLGFWGCHRSAACSRWMRFQYPLMNRLGFWGPPVVTQEVNIV